MNTSLPPHGPPGPDDELPDDAGLAALYRLLPQSEPGPALDAAILHAAAQAIAAADTTPLPHDERRKASRDSGDWVRPKAVTDIASARPSQPSSAARAPRHRILVALASAASLVLVAGLAWHMRGMNSQEHAPIASNAGSESAAVPSAPAAAPMPAMAAKTAMKLEASQSAPAVGSLTEESAASPARAVPQEAIAQPRMAMQAAKPAAGAVATAPMAEPAAAPMLRERESDKAMDAQANAAERKDARVQIMPTLVAPVREAPLRSPAPEAMPAPPSLADEVASAPAMLASPPAPPAPPAPEAPAAEKIIQAAHVAAPAQPDQSQAQDANPAQMRELEAIRKLFADHRDDEAQQRLEAFHQRHPQWQLQPDLKARLRKP